MKKKVKNYLLLRLLLTFLAIFNASFSANMLIGAPEIQKIGIANVS